MTRAGRSLPVPRLASSGFVRLAAALLALVPAAQAALVERCSWPPPGGPAIRPDSIEVEVAPMVGDLDGDGIPEIVFLSFATGLDDNFGRDGVLRIIRGSDCSEVASVEDVGCVSCFGDASCRSLETTGAAGIFCPACTPALADLDGDGRMEIVVVTEGDPSGTFGRRTIVLDGQGNFLSCSEETSEYTGPVAGVVLADLDSDGRTERVVRDVAWQSTGQIRFQHPLTGIGATMACDLDGDGRLEVTTGQSTYAADGTILWQNADLRGASPAVADFDLDCLPDLVVTSRNSETINIIDPLTGNVRASAALPAGDCPPRPDGQGGPPTLGDVDGDCIPEIGVAGCRRYALFKYLPGPPEQLVLAWESPVDDESSRITSSAIFDLEGDGTAEILYNDHSLFRVFDGLTGAVEASLPNTTYTLLEFPVVADADADGHADVLVASNGYWFCCDRGVRVLKDDAVDWAPVRPLFNEHSYHVTNILEDGTIPAGEQPSWSRYNTFRVQGEPLRDDGGPRLQGVPADESVRCGPVPPPASPTATGGCGETPPVTLDERTVENGCAQRLTVTRTWTATDRCGRSVSAVQVVTTTDDDPPVLSGVPADEIVRCVEGPPPAVEARDECDADPVVVLDETRVDGRCPHEYSLLRTWRATDACGNATQLSQRVSVTDDGPPRLVGVPADETVTCGTVPPPPEVTAEDGCDADPPVTLAEVRVDGSCPREYRLLRTWSTRDLCDNVVSATQVVTVTDDGPPRLVGVPRDETSTCEAPPPPVVTAEDGCDPDPPVTLDERRIDGPCPHEYRLLRTWSASDSCGHRVEATQAIDVQDDGPPRIVGAPGDVEVDCGAVPEPQSLRAEDGCDPDPPVTFSEVRVDGPCAGTYQLLRTWRCEDSCGHDALSGQTMQVIDRTPPRLVRPPQPGCLWPPNHWLVCFGPGDFGGTGIFEDDCGGVVSWRFTGCHSNQPENDLGDGNSAPDCIVRPDGTVCVRAERQGTDPLGRHYGLLGVAVDDCGNESDPVLVADVFVPHDESEHPECLKTNVVGYNDHQGRR